jgi:hypothetical protein
MSINVGDHGAAVIDLTSKQMPTAAPVDHMVQVSRWRGGVV